MVATPGQQDCILSLVIPCAMQHHAWVPNYWLNLRDKTKGLQVNRQEVAEHVPVNKVLSAVAGCPSRVLKMPLLFIPWTGLHKLEPAYYLIQPKQVFFLFLRSLFFPLISLSKILVL